jgi:hypothetical protein
LSFGYKEIPDMSFTPESGAFPPETDFFEQSSVVRIPERQTIVPAWYKRHTDPRGTIVTQNGKHIPPGFTVAEVAPELRWAIGEDGEVMEQLVFRQAHEKWYTAQYQAAGQTPDDPNLRSIPTVERFVARCVDPANPHRLQPILREPTQPAPALQPIHNAEGEKIEEDGEVEAPVGTTLKAPLPAMEPLVDPKPIGPDATEAEIRASIIAHGKDPDYQTPCGKDFPAGKQYIKQHTRWCKAPECSQ